ncbi:MAG: 3',5'-cyclic-nucleotide phosphodiesterase [Brachymonas sp.]|nr:3',5'-cyclic-nucleotide phosphodiesterase [Brachymonas sp.]
MQIKVLGAAGGIDVGIHTTAFLLDDDTLIDAGTGVCNLPLAVQLGIHQVFLTHAHLDHLAGLPFLAESVARYRADKRLPPIRVHALPEVLNALRQHIFNACIWPDLLRLPCVEHPALELMPLEVGGQVQLSQGRCVEAVSAAHSVPAVGFAVHQRNETWLFTGDTGRNPLLWQFINQLPQSGQRLRSLVAECTFADGEQAFADLTGHYTAHSLAQDMGEHLQRGQFDLYLSHLKPGDKAAIVQGLNALRQVAQAKGCPVHLLQQGHVFELGSVQKDAASSALA